MEIAFGFWILRNGLGHMVYPECNFTFVIKQEEPCEGKLSSTVPWEREGEIPSRDPTMRNAVNIVA